MKTLYLGDLYSRLPSILSEKTFVIGVKDSWSSLEVLKERIPSIKIERLPAVVNPRYLSNPSAHILQPAFIWKDE